MPAKIEYPVRRVLQVKVPVWSGYDVDKNDGTGTKGAKVEADKIETILCHRLSASKNEEYLVAWAGNACSWHSVTELQHCAQQLQDYVTGIPEKAKQFLKSASEANRKRKTSDRYVDPDEVLVSPFKRLKSSVSSSAPSNEETRSNGNSIARDAKVINDNLVCENSQTSVTSYGRGRKEYSAVLLPTLEQLQRAVTTPTQEACKLIRQAYFERLAALPGPPVTIFNKYGEDSPPLSFSFISESQLGEGVHATPTDMIFGCGTAGDPHGCRPDMGQGIGCEYSRKCECLEFAAVDVQRCSEAERAKYDHDQDGTGLPKRFPYHTRKAEHRGCLVTFYRKSRAPIYECNPACNCGPKCKTRLVQHGRTVPLQIFKTRTRGWGLRCAVALRAGQFIDTYRGELITNAEYERRRAAAPAPKNSYFFVLDKFVAGGDGGVGLALDDCCTIDGERCGGPTRFINHSCDPNCRQYTVSYNKYDYTKYELAFFACRDIPAGEELTFDYLDRDELDEDAVGPPGGGGGGLSQTDKDKDKDKDEDDMIECLCGSANCRKRLWI